MKKTVVLGLMLILLLAAACNSTPLASIQATLPDMQGKPDGVYRGAYDLAGTPVKVVVDVTVQDEKIAAVHIVKHFCSPIGKKAEKITQQIIDQQSLSVDAVSGATGSSKAILKAAEAALR